MVRILAKLFIKNSNDTSNPSVRQAYGTLCGILGIILNVFLFAIKFFAGSISGAISITADAFNNLSDAGSSAISLIGFRLAGQKPDKDHPFGHGRVEYVAGLIVSMAVLLMGFELGKSSFEKILNPDSVAFSWLTVGILVASILIKLYMGFYNRSVGKKIDSPTLNATATDCLSDCLSTLAVLAALFVNKFTSINVDAYCGLAVSLIILYAGYKSAKDTISPLLGNPPSPELVREIEELVLSHEDVLGIHDLIIHDYGPGRFMISLHAEVSSKCDLLLIHDTIDGIEQTLSHKFGCDATIHMDPIECDNEVTNQARLKAAALVKKIDDRITIHDFRMVSGPTHTNLIFDAVIPFDIKLTDKEVLSEIDRLVSELDGGQYFAVVKIDRSYTEI